MIDVNKTELSESNYNEFMEALDLEFKNQHPNFCDENSQYSTICTKEQWLLENHGSTVQDIIDAEVETWGDDAEYLEG